MLHEVLYINVQTQFKLYHNFDKPVENVGVSQGSKEKSRIM